MHSHTIRLPFFTRMLPALALAGVIALAPAFAFAKDGRDDGAKRFAIPERATLAVDASGRILVRGAKVTAVSGSAITVQATWPSSSMTWTLQADSATEYYGYDGKSSALAAIAVGNTLSFSGSLTGASTVDADIIRNWSTPTERQATLAGTVASISGSALTLSGKGFATTTVTTNASTTVTKDGAVATLADIASGALVKVQGIYTASNNTLAAAKIAIITNASRPNPEKDILKGIKDLWKDFRGKGKSDDDGHRGRGSDDVNDDH